MTLKNEFGDTIEVTDKIKATLNNGKELNYGYFTTVGGAKRWVNKQRGEKTTWNAGI